MDKMRDHSRVTDERLSSTLRTFGYILVPRGAHHYAKGTLLLLQLTEARNFGKTL
jgi:hypothetical protein